MNDSEQRQRRLRGLVRKLNRDRRRQSQKIDLLCHDLIEAQRDFIRRLGTVRFVAGFYKSLLGVTDLQRLLELSARHLAEVWPDLSLTFYLRQFEGFRQYRTGDPEQGGPDGERFEHGLTDALAETLCRMARPCGIEELLGLGYQVSPALLKRYSVMTLPLVSGPRCIGFMLLYRPGSNSLQEGRLDGLRGIGQGLAQAIEACESLSGVAHRA